MPRIVPSQIRYLLASILVIVLLTPLSRALAQQKPASPSPHSRAQLEDRVKELEARLNAAEQKAASAAMEKDYITRVQKQYETYYKEVLSTQTWTLAIFGFILTAVFALAAKFSMNIFDIRTKSALDAALAQVEKKFGEQMQKELETLRQQNSTQLKTLEDGLTKRITEQEQGLKMRSDYQLQFAQGLSFHLSRAWNGAIKHYRLALTNHKKGKPRGIFETLDGGRAAANLFRAMLDADRATFEEAANKELELDLYKGLEDELNFAATEVSELAPLLRKK